MTLDGVMAVTLHYLTEFGKSVFQYITASICGGVLYDVVVKKVYVRYLIS